MRINATTLQVAAIAAAFLTTGAARADNSPLGLWIDHTGRGAVEIKECNGNKVCGHIVWLKDSKNLEACGEQILGDVKPVGGGKWDNGWIYDPDAESKYDVELTPLGDKMKVVGYAGSKWLSETMTWKRAPSDLQRCSKSGSTAAAAPANDTKTATTTATPSPQPDNKDAGKDAKQAAVTPAPVTANPAPAAAPKDNATAESKPEETAKTEPQVEPQADPKDAPKAESNGDNAKPKTDNDDAAKNDDDDDKEANAKPGKALKEIAEAMNFKKLKNGKCKMDVPFVDMKVTFDCDQ